MITDFNPYAGVLPRHIRKEQMAAAFYAAYVQNSRPVTFEDQRRGESITQYFCRIADDIIDIAYGSKTEEPKA